MAILLSNFPQIIPGEEGYNKSFYDTLDNAPVPVWDKFFNTVPNHPEEFFTRIGLSDVGRIPLRAGVAVPMDELSIAEMYRKNARVLEYAARFESQNTQWEKLPANIKGRLPELFANSAIETIEYLAFGVLRGGFADVGPDGQPLFSNAHPLPTGGTLDNLATVALSSASASAVRAAMMRHTSPQGHVLSGNKPKYCVTGPELGPTAREIFGASWMVAASTGSDYNDNRAAVEVIDSAQIADVTDFYMVADPANYPYGAVMVFARQPQFTSGFTTETAKYWGYVQMELVATYCSWRWAYGCSVAG